ncbi:ribosome-binding protein 1-like isoform X3 [Penaeus indicus]|uniref:ribosome-binding protein 1-like isoform X3 n=1 Tax=Penaeus indicus TaxID=29960 RepID=UPI00300D89AA
MDLALIAIIMASAAIGLQYQRKEYLTKILELEMQTEERQPLLRNETGISHQTTGSTQAELIEAEEGTLKKREERWRDLNKTRGAQSTHGGRVEAAASKGPGVSQQAKGPTQATLIEAEDFLKEREEKWRDLNKTRGAQSTQGGRVEAAASKGPGVSQQAKGPTQAELIEAEEDFLKEREEKWRDLNKTRGAQSTHGGRVEAAASKGPGVSQQAKGPTQAELIEAEEDFLKEREEKWRDLNKTRGAQSTQGGRVEAAASKGPGVSQQAKGLTQATLIEAEDFLKEREEKWRDLNKTRGAQSTHGGRVEAAASKGPGVSQQAKGPTQATLIEAEDFLKEREEKWRDLNKTRGAQSTHGGRVEAEASKGPGVSQQAKGLTQATLIEAEDFLKEREEKWRDLNKTRGAQSTHGGRVEAAASKGPGVSQQAKGLTQAELIEAEEGTLKKREERRRDMNKTRGAQPTHGGRVEAGASKGPGVSQQAKAPTLAEFIEAEEDFLKERVERWRNMDKDRECQPLTKRTQK